MATFKGAANRLAEGNSAKFQSQFSVLSQAAVGVVLVRTREPSRALRALRAYALSNRVDFRSWNALDGWTKASGPADDEEPDRLTDPLQALLYVGNEQQGNGVYAMTYLHYYVPKVPVMVVALKKFAEKFASNKKRLVLIAPQGFTLPAELEDDILILDFDTPSASELNESITAVVDNVSAGKRPPLERSDRDRLIAVMSGMTAFEAETALSRALIENKAALPNVGVDLLSDVLTSVKVEVVKRTEILEVMAAEAASNIGGLEALKQWLAMRARCFSPEAAAAHIDPPKGIALIGPPGCLSGSTVLDLRWGKRNHGRGITIGDAYQTLHGIGEKRGHSKDGPHVTCNVLAGAQWNRELDCFVPSLLDDRIGYHRVVDIVKSGVKETFIVGADNGQFLRVTEEHPFKVPDGTEGADQEGFKVLAALNVGDRVVVRSTEKYQGGRKPNKERRTVYSIPNHPHVHKNTVGGTDYKRLPYARIVLEARMNGLSVDEYVSVLRKDQKAAETLLFIPPEFDVHHIDGNPMNDEIGNLMVMAREGHHLANSDEDQKHFGDVLATEATITSIVPYGIEMTYDLVMAEPFPNYIAHGFVVHNTGKSLVAKATAHMLGLPLIRFDVGRVFGSLVGQSEERVRSALKMVDGMSPLVLMLDEADKAFQVSGGGDSGVGQRVLGAILTWMQETKSQVFVVITANRVENLPAEFLRRGRLDEVWSVSVPNEEERLAVLKIHLRKRGVDPEKIADIDQAVSRSNGYVPAELEGAVKDAKIISFTTGAPMTGSLIADQLANMVPLSEAFAAQFEAMELWARNNARPANARIGADGQVRVRQRRSPAASQLENRGRVVDL